VLNDTTALLMHTPVGMGESQGKLRESEREAATHKRRPAISGCASSTQPHFVRPAVGSLATLLGAVLVLHSGKSPRHHRCT